MFIFLYGVQQGDLLNVSKALQKIIRKKVVCFIKSNYFIAT